MHLILTGATGMVGTAVLHHILSLPATSPIAQKINRVSIISRRPEVPLLQHPDRPKQNTFTQVQVLHHTDFKDFEKDGLLAKLKGEEQDQKIAVIWALGVSQTLTSSEEQYDEITRIYPLEAAKAFSQTLEPKQLNFVYVSGEGATPSPGFMTPLFGRVKGRTETELIELMDTQPYSKNLKVFNVRPGGVDAGAEADQKIVNELTHANDGGTGGTTRNTLGMRAMEKLLLPVFRSGVYKAMHSPTAEMARVMVELAVGDGEPVNVRGAEAGGRTLRNVALRRLGGSVK
ncbi:hypothetical protein PMZ80_009065 [Knufia obscura]|uniref:Nucleoside-diphosphate-sugar epimerase n=1 Tax=Knufia obscura TaxID=1635080 RepID=A0ABR0RF81_9EURO|nr:hypothetical protein PMZ80_009065 [Knufia obscura]